MNAAFSQLAEARDESPVLHIEGRQIQSLRKAGGLVWFDFRALCGGPRSQNDYLEIASQFHTVLLSKAWMIRLAKGGYNAIAKERILTGEPA